MKKNTGLRYLGIIISGVIGLVNIIICFMIAWFVLFYFGYHVFLERQSDYKANQYRDMNKRVNYFYQNYDSFIYVRDFFVKNPDVMGITMTGDWRRVFPDYYEYELEDNITIYTQEEVSLARLKLMRSMQLDKHLNKLDMDLIERELGDIVFTYGAGKKYEVSYTYCNNYCTTKNSDATFGYYQEEDLFRDPNWKQTYRDYRMREVDQIAVPEL